VIAALVIAGPGAGEEKSSHNSGWAIPDKRVNMTNLMPLSLDDGGQRYEATAIYQVPVKKRIKKGDAIVSETVAAYEIGGLPLQPPPSLDVNNRFEFVLQPPVIRIEGSTRSGLLLLTKDSCYPVYIDTGKGRPDLQNLVTVVGASWEFTKAGIAFETEEGRFVSARPGATIKFSDAGARVDGIMVTQQPEASR